MNLEIFNTANLFEAGTGLFQQLGILLNSNTSESLPVKDILKEHYKDRDIFRAIKKTYFLGIIDDSVFNNTSGASISYSYEQASQQGNNNYNGLMLFALELNRKPGRSEISELTRTFNRISQKMPVALLLRYPSTSLLEEKNTSTPLLEEKFISLSISERFQYLQNWRQGEKIGKVIILKDISTTSPHAGHIRILTDLKNHRAKNFSELHQHWLQVLDVNILNQKFYQELSNWYFYAIDRVYFPNDLNENLQIYNPTHLIRLITRLIFIWFLKEKKLIPESLFDKEYIATILKNFNENSNSHHYYNAILQNLFFGTLNQRMNERKFAREGDFKTNKEEYGVKNLYRYADLFKISEEEVLKLFENIPFLNGGLFDCLDKPDENGRILYVDGFSRNSKKKAIIPDELFFGDEKKVDLNKYYDKKNKASSVKGLINILNNYKFTITENTPIEEEVALDPELLGRVFENLLASYNPETQTTARKATGSYYTPREIVNYMVDESLLEYLKSNISVPADTQSNASIPAGIQSNASIPADTQSNASIPAGMNSNQHEEDIYTFFNPNNEVKIHTGNLPHWQQENVWYFVTFRLADSIPDDVAEKLKSERELWLKKNKVSTNIPVGDKKSIKRAPVKLSKEQMKEYYRLFSERIERLLDDCKGSCVLKDEKIGKIVADALLHFNNQRYILDEWVIMPNHVHVLVKPLGEYKLPDILHSWKSFTANKINEQLGTKGQVWMHESYDHIVRNEKAFEAIRNYIRQNPVKAGLSRGGFLSSEYFLASAQNGSKGASVQNGNKSKDAFDTFESRLRDLLSYSDKPNPFSEVETKAIIEAIDKCKILDPACGSGAFPMGILHKMVHILQKLDPKNNYWKELQKQKAIQETQKAFDIGKKEEREQRLKEINEVFENNTDDYGRKLYLIENCIYGIDIQPIAVQIAKLRFFISLIIDQKVDRNKENFGIRSLPNLETKFVAANTLIGLDKPKQLVLRNPEIEEKEAALKEIRHKYFVANTRKEKMQLQEKDKKLRQEISKMLEKDGWQTTVAQQIASFDPYDQNQSATWFDPEWMFGIKVYTEQGRSDGFDIVIGNPPYISTKGVESSTKKLLEQQYGFADDTYNHFYFKGIKLLNDSGILAYISSKTFWTIQTKKNLRQLLLNNTILQLFDTANPFESAMVDTCVAIVKKSTPGQNHKVIFLDGKKDLVNPETYSVEQKIYATSPNQVFFAPTPYNLKIYERLGKKVNELLNQWWDLISTSKNIEKNKRKLEEYRKSLKPGDITLLGLITEGGQGLATANNGKYVGVLEDTKWAELVYKQRPEKLLLATKFCKKQGIKSKQDAQKFLEELSETEIRKLFDDLKEKYGRDIFGQGWLYRIVSRKEIANVEALTEDEKLNGIKGAKTFVPYDKGDKDGNRWYAPTPYYIDWSRENVKFLKENSGKKGEGMPVVRNPQFYFREGFCWTDVNSTYLKSRLKENGVYDVLTMSLFSCTKIPDWYFVCLINSKFISEYVDDFVNSVSSPFLGQF